MDNMDNMNNINIEHMNLLHNTKLENIKPKPIIIKKKVNVEKLHVENAINLIGSNKSRPVITKKTRSYYCYLIYSNKIKNLTYNGSTPTLEKRIRQHNGELTGGAKATIRGRPWTYFAILTGFPNRRNCLSCEWKLKNPVNGLRVWKYSGMTGRIKALDLVLKSKKWTQPCTDMNKDMKLHLWILKPYDKILTDVPSNITVYPVDNIDIDMIKLSVC